MKTKTEKEYFNELWDKMKAAVMAFIDNGDQEELHRFRVQVKKLRAMLLLFDTYAPKLRLLKDFKPVRKIFKQGGIIRDAYIHLQLGVHYRLSNPEFINSQQQVIDEGIHQFGLNKAKYLKAIKKAHTLLQGQLKPIRNSNIVDFYRVGLSKIAADIGTLEFDDTLHGTRRKIKILLYNYKFAGDALAGKLPVNINYLDKLQEQIGKWHDNTLAIRLFESAGLNGRLVVAKIKGQNTRLKKAIATLASDFWVKATTVEDTVIIN